MSYPATPKGVSTSRWDMKERTCTQPQSTTHLAPKPGGHHFTRGETPYSRSPSEESPPLEPDLRTELQTLGNQNERKCKEPPVAKIPDEILSYIFQMCVEGDRGEFWEEEIGSSPGFWLLSIERGITSHWIPLRCGARCW